MPAPLLPARQALWELAAEAAGIGTYVLRLPERQLIADDRLLELAGVDRGTFTGRPEDVYARIHPDDVEDVAAQVERAVATGEVYSAEYRVLDPAGRTRWTAARGQTVTDEAGAVTALLGAAYDITPLREAVARTSEVLESMAVGYVAVDDRWRVTYLNAEGERLTGIAAKDLVGRDFWAAFPGAVGTVFERHYRHTALTGETSTFDAHYPQPLDIWVEVRAVAERGGLGLYFLDITARRVAQDAAQRSDRARAALGDVALALASSRDVHDLVTTMTERGLAAMGCDGGSVAIPDPDDPGVLLSSITSSFGQGAQAEYGRLPVDAALPVCEAFRSGRRVLVPDLAASLAYSPLMRQVIDATGCPVYASLPLRDGDRVMGVLTAGWTQPQPFDDAQLALLDTFAAQCAQALQRLAAHDAERASAQAARRAAQQQASLVSLAHTLGSANSQDAVLAVIDAKGKELLNAGGAGLCLLEPDGGHVRTLVTDDYTRVHGVVHRTPVDFPLPAVHSAATGATHFHSSRSETAALFPGADELYAAAGVEASAAVPLRTRGDLLGCLSVGFPETRLWSQDEQDLVSAFAALTAQALERIASRDAERDASHAVARFSETLQRSLLTAPAQPDHLQIAVRYAPAAADAQVGGDWYDSFMAADGTTSLVIGDVTGHDQHAAAAMGQLRNLVRGIGYALGRPPADVLTVLDHAVHDLAVEALATVVLAQVEQTEAEHAAGLRTLRWSNAGHLPPLLIAPDGTARHLDTEPDLLLGLQPDTARTDHHVTLHPGSTVLLYTDGLVERRDAPLQEGLDWLAHTVLDLAHLSLDELCDRLLAQVGDRVEDDVALLALRAHPEDAPRPAEAGPGNDPLAQPTLTDQDSA